MLDVAEIKWQPSVYQQDRTERKGLVFIYVGNNESIESAISVKLGDYRRIAQVSWGLICRFYQPHPACEPWYCASL